MAVKKKTVLIKPDIYDFLMWVCAKHDYHYGPEAKANNGKPNIHRIFDQMVSGEIELTFRKPGLEDDSKRVLKDFDTKLGGPGNQHRELITKAFQGDRQALEEVHDLMNDLNYGLPFHDIRTIDNWKHNTNPDQEL